MNKNVYLFIIFLLIINILPKTNSKASINSEIYPKYCLKFNELDKSKINDFEITIKKNRKWQKNLYRAYLNNQKFISKNFKKKFNAELIVNFVDKKKCNFKAKIRFSGDRKDHIKKINNNILSSLDVEIDENILGIVRFKLILTEAREPTAEIFSSLFLKKMNFLSPKVFLINTKINNVKNDYLFVENSLRKEFLENNKRVEGPILSSDDETLFNKNKKFRKFTLARLRNPEWIKLDVDNLNISIEAITRLNFFFITQSLRNRHFGLNLNGNLDNFEKNFFLDDYYLNQYYLYIALVNSIGANKNFTLSDSRFYFNKFKNDFELIFNDGNSNLFSLSSKIDYDLTSNVDTRSVNYLVKKIENIDTNKLLSELNKSNISFDDKKLINLINLVNSRLDKINNNNIKNLSNDLFIKNFFNLDKFLELIETTKQYYSYFHEGNFYLCVKKNKCKKIILTEKKVKKLLGQRLYIDSKKVFFIGDSKIKNFFVYPRSWKKKNIQNIKILYTTEDTIKFDLESKSIFLNPLNLDSRFLISDSDINDWNIIINSSNINILNVTKNIQTMQPFKKNDKFYKSMPGCVTFYNINFDNTSLKSNNSYCEDSINIIKSTGTLNMIEVTDSMSDGLDLDFSNLKIKKIYVKNSKNDCIDLSFGNYIINHIFSKKCNDKGISIGEKSNVKIKNYKNLDSLHAIAVKDSSSVIVDNFNSLNFKQSCLNVYRKKQEFMGAYLMIKSINAECLKNNNFIQKNSKLEIIDAF